MFLERGELRARKHFEGNNAGDEGLEDRAAQQSAIARMNQTGSLMNWIEGTNLSR